MNYFKHFLPIACGSLFYALNGIVDNFMVGRIDQGVTALSAINQWGFIIFGWFLATSAFGSVMLAQFNGDNRIDYVKKISCYRTFLCFIFVLPFVFVAWFYPRLLISTFYEGGSDAHSDKMVYKYGREYVEIIAFQWLLIAISFNFGKQLTELGYGKYRMYFGFATLFLNIFLNSMLMFVANMKVRGAAIATVSGRLLFIILVVFVIIKNRLPVALNFLLVYKVDRKIMQIFWRRWIYILSVFTVNFFIGFRGFFYARGYTAGSLGIGVSATSVLGLTGSIMNLFTITFSAIVSMTALFVASELGKGNYQQALQNANELKGFNTLMAFLLSLVMIIFAAFIPMMDFLSADQYKANVLRFSATSQLKHVRNSLFVLAAMYPSWIWFTTSYRNGNAGGKGKKFAIFDWITTGPLQLGWLALIMLVIVPAWPAISANFAIAYALFFIFDFIKLIGIEWFYYRNHDWLYSITKNEVDPVSIPKV